MKKPTKAYVCGKPHRIEYPAVLDGLEGIESPDRRVIIVRCAKHTTKEDVFERLCHEIFHVISDELDVGLKEKQVRVLAVMWADVLVRNKWIKQ